MTRDYWVSRSMMPGRAIAAVLGSFVILGLAGCGVEREASYPTKDPLKSSRYVLPSKRAEAEQNTLFGPGGVPLFGDTEQGPVAPGIAVNSYLWRASLDTLSFMPLASADPFGGVIITEWHSPSETPNERFKANVFILDQALRADGIRVGIFRQVRDESGAWQDAPVSPETATQLENAILTRARQMRVADVG